MSIRAEWALATTVQRMALETHPQGFRPTDVPCRVSSNEPSETVTIGDLRREELDLIGWSGTSSHIKNVAGQLDRRDLGLVEYLVVRDRTGAPIAKGAIDYEETRGVGTIIQMATRPDLEGRGHASRLIAEAEKRIRTRGLPKVRLAVEPDNARAKRLYEHLGYRPVGERETGWEYDREDGVVGWYRTVVIDLEKTLDTERP